MKNYLFKVMGLDGLQICRGLFLFLTQALLIFVTVGCSSNNGWTVTMIPTDTDIGGVSLSPDGELLAASHPYGTYYEDFEVLLFSTNQPLEESLAKPITQIDYPGVELAWSPDGQQLAMGALTGDIAIWNINDKSIGREFRVIPPGLDISSANPKQILWPEPGDRLLPIYLLDLPLVDPSSGQIVDMLDETGSEWICGAAWTSEGGLIAASSTPSDSIVRIWDSHTTELLYTFEYTQKRLCPLEWSPSGDKLVFRYGDTSIMIWDAHSGNVPKELLQLERPPHQISWSPDGDILAIGLDGGILVLWDMEQNTEIYRQDLNYSPDQYIHSLTWFPDSKTLIVSGTSVTIFEITGP